eukprot:929603-Prorocentrum_minimum.AAC.1
MSHLKFLGALRKVPDFHPFVNVTDAPPLQLLPSAAADDARHFRGGGAHDQWRRGQRAEDPGPQRGAHGRAPRQHRRLLLHLQHPGAGQWERCRAEYARSTTNQLRLWRARGTISGGVARRELRQPADQARGRLAAEGPPQHKHLPHPLASAGLRQVAARAPGPAGRAPKSDHPRGAGFPGGGDAERRPRRCRAHPPHRRRRPEGAPRPLTEADSPPPIHGFAPSD